MMLPISFPLAEEEDFSGWCSAMAFANDLYLREFIRTYFDYTNSIETDMAQHIKNLDWVCENCGSLGIPNVEQLLRKHTDILAASVFESEYRLSMTLHDALRKPAFGGRQLRTKHEPFRYCPLCMQEDFEKYGRIVAHVPHQMCGVTSCYRHSVRLSCFMQWDQFKSASEMENKVAQYTFSLFQNPVNAAREDVAPYFLAAWARLGTKEKQEMMQMIGVTRESDVYMMIRHKTQISQQIVMLQALLIDDVSNLRQYEKAESEVFEKCVAVIHTTDPDAQIVKTERRFAKVTCGRCGGQYKIQYPAAMYNGICPYCFQAKGDDERKLAAVKAFLGPEFEIQDFRCGPAPVFTIKHIPCGHVRKLSQGSLFQRSHFCRKCHGRMHEKKIMNNGMEAEVIRYRKSVDIDVRFEDGTVKEHVSYHAFAQGAIAHPSYFESRFGEKHMMICGLEATIVEYNSSHDIVVEYSNGYRVKTNYQSFINGLVGPPPPDRVGLTKTMNCGLKATIVKYNNAKDCTVEFEDGRVREKIQYANFLKGNILPCNIRRKQTG